jgi:aryl-alcohol dehydrogenase-like predicted oxidoreductase
MKHVKLGRSDVEISAIGLGCWQFSEEANLGGRFWRALGQERTNEIVQTALDGGVSFFDTAEMYGDGASERGLAAGLAAAGKADGDVVVATKWNPILRRASSLLETIETRKANLGGFSIDLHQVHNPASISSTESEMEAMAELVQRGDVRHVGVSNFSRRLMAKASDALEKRGLHLASNQMRYSLLDRHIESNGVLDLAKERGITLIAYSPLAQGLLTGRFHDDPSKLDDVKLPRRLALRAFGGFERSRPVIAELKRIAHMHDATPAQVALAWLVQFHGDSVVAIPGASSTSQAASNAGAGDLTLNDDELARLDEISRPFA